MPACPPQLGLAVGVILVTLFDLYTIPSVYELSQIVLAGTERGAGRTADAALAGSNPGAVARVIGEEGWQTAKALLNTQVGGRRLQACTPATPAARWQRQEGRRRVHSPRRSLAHPALALLPAQVCFIGPSNGIELNLDGITVRMHAWVDSSAALGHHHAVPARRLPASSSRSTCFPLLPAAGAVWPGWHRELDALLCSLDLGGRVHPDHPPGRTLSVSGAGRLE